MKTSRLVGLVLTLLTAGAFSFPARADEYDRYTGWPCEVDEECTLSRINPIDNGAGKGWEAIFHDQNGNTYHSDCVTTNPVTNFKLTFTVASSSIWTQDVINYPIENNCGGGGTAWEVSAGTRVQIGSTYTSSTYEKILEMLPSYSWESSTSSGNGSSTSMIRAIATGSMFEETSDRFPGCFANPLLELIEALNATTNGTADPQSLQITIPRAGQGTPETLSLDFSDSSMLPENATAFSTAIGNLLMGFLWLGFSIYVLIDVKNNFSNREHADPG